MSYCKKPLIKFDDYKGKRFIRDYGKKFISWKWFKEKTKINKYLLKNQLSMYPCGSCLNCINMKRFHWVKKLSIEKNNWLNTYFITITYNDINLPDELKVKDLQNFIKYLRKFIKPLKYFACGEYGSITKRPHYHLILFCNDNLDLNFLKYTRTGPLFESELLNKCWLHKGFIWVGYDFNNMSFAYVSAYSNKKYLKQYNTSIINFSDLQIKKVLENDNLNGFQKYIYIDEIIKDTKFKKPEFIIMSKNPPIGANNLQYVKDAPSSLLKWKAKEFYKSFKPPKDYFDKDTNGFLKMYLTDFENELLKRKKDYEIFLKNNNMYDIITNDEMLYNKKHSSKNKFII